MSLLRWEDHTRDATHVVPMGNYVITGVGNYVIENPSNLGNFMIADNDTWTPSSHQPYNWITVGGTSASSPFIAGLYSRAGVPATVHGPNMIYAAPASGFHDVTSGANAPRGVCSSLTFDERVCTADIGWDGPTGRGTPVGLTPFG